MTVGGRVPYFPTISGQQCSKVGFSNVVLTELLTVTDGN